jgi:AcrR family transcriptional regulator
MSRAAREQQLLDVAEKVFGERGYQETTMEDIAAEAGITKPVIYNHFGSKERLLGAVVDRARDELLEETSIAQRALDGTGASVEDYFRAGVVAFMRFFERRRDSFRVYQQEGAVAAAAGGDIEALRLAQARVIAEDLRAVPTLQELPIDLLDGIAESIIATNERVAGWWLRNPNITLDTAVDLVMGVIWHGLGSASPLGGTLSEDTVAHLAAPSAPAAAETETA